MHGRPEEPLLVCQNLKCRKVNLDLDANCQVNWGELRRKLCSSCFNIHVSDETCMELEVETHIFLPNRPEFKTAWNDSMALLDKDKSFEEALDDRCSESFLLKNDFFCKPADRRHFIMKMKGSFKRRPKVRYLHSYRAWARYRMTVDETLKDLYKPIRSVPIDELSDASGMYDSTDDE